MESETEIRVFLQNDFVRLRQRQRESVDLPFKVSADIKSLAHYVNTHSLNPVTVLKSMGVMFFGATAGFKLSVLPGQLVSSKNRILQALRAEGWTSVESNQNTEIESLVGANELKNWVVLNVPGQSEISEFLSCNPRLIATEESFGLDHAPQEILIGPGMPPQEVLTEPHFPLVSIQYERATETVEVASFQPLQRAVERNMKIEHKDKVTIGQISDCQKENG
jgi:hypothetical protein